MDLQEIQRRTETPRDGTDQRSPAVQGCHLAAAAGTVLAAVARGQHGLRPDGGYGDALREGLAALLHQAVTLADTIGLDIGDVPARSLTAIEDLDGPATTGAGT